MDLIRPLVCHRHGCRNGAKPGCKRHNAGAKGRDAGSRSRIQAVSAVQVPIGANGWILLREPASDPGMQRCTAAGESSMFGGNHPPYFADSRVRNAERSMFIPPKVSRGE